MQWVITVGQKNTNIDLIMLNSIYSNEKFVESKAENTIE